MRNPALRVGGRGVAGKRYAVAGQSATGTAPISGYGTSETLCLVLYGDDDTGLLRPTPLTSVRYADDADRGVPQRIWVRNPTLAVGYWHRPEAQADGFRDGWFSPGDMFLRRDAERLEFTGRSDDLLKVSGQWVSTLWIEHALAEAGGDALDQVAAVGVPTPEGLTTIAALAVAVRGREDEARRRIDAGIAKLPMYRRPRWVHWVHELPLTATGKAAAQSPARCARFGALPSGVRSFGKGPVHTVCRIGCVWIRQNPQRPRSTQEGRRLCRS